MISITPITLERDGITLEPLGLQHVQAVKDAAADGQLHLLWYTSVPAADQTEGYIQSALAARAAGTRFHWVVRETNSSVVLGCTSFHDIVVEADRVEIGYTWYRQSRQRTSLNTVCKLMLMEHAFETLGCAVVGWRTDIFNHRSQRAIERLGAQRDGVIRHHAVRTNRTVRDTVMYSMQRSDWSAAKEQLEKRLTRDQPTKKIEPADISLVAVDSPDKAVALIRCKAGALGERFVADNASSIAQASFVPYSWLRAIEFNGKTIGLVLLSDPSIAPIEDEPRHKLWIWRLMVDFAYQHRGIGEIVIQQIIQHAHTRPGISIVILGTGQEPGNAQDFYRRLGFVATGKISDGEVEMEFTL